MGSNAALIEVRGLTWVPPGADSPVLEDFDFEVDEGECVVLRGPSGVGKSSLLRCIVLFEDRTAGEIRWNGEAIQIPNVLEYRRRVGYVQQRPVSIAETIEENLAFAREMGGSEAMKKDEQWELLGRLGLGDLDGARDFEELSGGEQQRVSLVRSLTPRPDVLLLDEPTASLDEDRVSQVERFLLDYLEEKAGRALVWVTHSREQAERLGDRTVEMPVENPAEAKAEDHVD